MPEAGSGEAAPVSSLLKISIVEQIEYYFGDFNMMRDKFLKAESLKNNGWVPIKTLLRFNRLSALSKDADVILSAFKDNPSEIVEVDVENKNIRRNPNREIPEPGENWRSTVAHRTVYAKGFPIETTTLDDILKFIQTFGKVDNVFKRNYYDKALKEWKFKGSVFISFPTREDAQKFLDIKSVKYAGNELVRKWQMDYVEDKKTERIQNKLKAKEEKEKLLKDQVELDTDQKLPSGALIQLVGLKGDINLMSIKKKLTEDLKWEVSYIDYSVGEMNAYVRLQEADSAKKALSELSENSFQINDMTIKAELVEGEKETELLKKMETDRSSRVLQRFMKSKNKGGKRNKNFRQKGRRGGRNDDKMDVIDASSSAESSENANIDSKNTENANTDSKSTENANTDSKSTENANIDSKSSDKAKDSIADSASLKRKPEESASGDGEVAKKSKPDE